MLFGGFLGIGDSYHPLPWNVLTYDTGLGGYVVDSLATSSKAGRPIRRVRRRTGLTRHIQAASTSMTEHRLASEAAPHAGSPAEFRSVSR